MNKFLLLLLCICICISCNKQTTIYLVRHAEKIDNSRDPDLSEAGKQRAAILADVLKNEKIKSIYSTNFKRTQQTAAPLASMKNIIVQTYRGDSLNAFAADLLKTRKNSLVVGHSNTTITLLDALGVQQTIQKLEDNDYGNLFKVIVKGKTKRLEENRF